MLGNHPFYAALPASDVERAAAFYGDTLGLSIEGDPAEGMILVATGDTMFQVYRSDYAGTNQATAGGWMVPDIEKAVAMLRQAGVDFKDYDLGELKTDERGIAIAPGGSKAAWFEDTEGNIIGLVQEA